MTAELKKKNKPRLLFLTEFYPQSQSLIFTGGVEARTYYLSQKAKKDFEVKLIYSRSKAIAATSLSVFSRLTYIFSSFFKALKTDFDLIEGSNVTTYLPAYFAGKLKKKPTIAWIPDVLNKDWFQFGLFVGIFGFILEKISLKLNWSQIIALSDSTKQKLVSQGINTQKISVARGGYDPQEFLLPSPKKSSKPTIITIARLVKTKRVKDLIKAFDLVTLKLPQSQLIIIGSGPEKKALVDLTKKLKLELKVTFLSNLSRRNLIITLKKSHLFCLPSSVEGFGLVTIEAMAANLPAVISNLRVHQEITHKGQGVLFFTPTNYKDLSQKIRQLLTNEKLYRQKQLQAQNLIKNYTWDKIYQNSRKAYLKTL